MQIEYIATYQLVQLCKTIFVQELFDTDENTVLLNIFQIKINIIIKDSEKN